MFPYIALMLSLILAILVIRGESRKLKILTLSFLALTLCAGLFFSKLSSGGNSNKIESESIQKDLKTVLNIEISYSDAQKIYESKKNNDDGYNEILIRSTDQSQRLFEAFYRVEGNKVNIYREYQSGVYMEVK